MEGSTMYDNIKVKQAASGRYALIARTKPGEKWVQIESVRDEKSARELAEDWDTFDTARIEQIEEAEEEGEGSYWGDDVYPGLAELNESLQRG
jgi:hypothetical protein